MFYDFSLIDNAVLSCAYILISLKISTWVGIRAVDFRTTVHGIIMNSFFILERPRTSIYLGKRSHQFTSFQKKGLHYINTPKQLMPKGLNFYDTVNDNVNVKIVIVLLLFYLAQK